MILNYHQASIKGSGKRFKGAYAQTLAFSDGSIIMGKADVLRAYQRAKNETIIAVHMDAVNHAMQSRADLRIYIDEMKMDKSRALVPDDGQSYQF